MSIQSPLQILLFRHPDDADITPYAEAILRAFQGGKEAGTYLATGEDLGIQLLDFATAPPQPPDQLLGASCHTMIVVLVDAKLLGLSPVEFWDWLAEAWKLKGASGGKHAVFIMAMDERTGDAISRKAPALGTLQLLFSQNLGERAIRPALLALQVLHECRMLLARALPLTPPAGHEKGHLKFFISHAKMDGLPLAYSLKHQIETLPYLKKFYDAEDLPPGCQWQSELENGVAGSLIIILRTEGYETRPWCRQEVMWADEYATPAVMVDARTGLQFSGGELPFDRVPTVRIPDGNLFRILFLALREGLRFLHFMRYVEAMKANGDLPDPVTLRVFSLPPSMSALLRVCSALALETSSAPQMILYPDPPLRAGPFEAAVALVKTYCPKAQLITPNELVARKRVTP